MAIRSDGQTLSKDDVLFPRLRPDEPGWALYRLCRETWRPEFKPTVGARGGVGLFWVLGGHGISEGDGWRQGLRAGCMIVSVWEKFTCSSKPATPLTMMVVGLSGADARDVFEKHLGRSNAVLVPKNPQAVTEVLETMFTIGKERGPFAEDILRQYIPILLLTLRRGLLPRGDSQSRGFSQYLACKRYIDRNFSGMSGIQEAADECGITTTYMARLFREHAGDTPNTYFVRLRMNLAAQLLQTTDLPVQRVAERLDYANQYAFSKAFKRVIGFSPRHYRERHGWVR